MTLSAFFTIKGELDSHRQTEFSWKRTTAIMPCNKELRTDWNRSRRSAICFVHPNMSAIGVQSFCSGVVVRHSGIHALEWIELTKRVIPPVVEPGKVQGSDQSAI